MLHLLMIGLALAIVFDAGFVVGSGWNAGHHVYRCPFCGKENNL